MRVRSTSSPSTATFSSCSQLVASAWHLGKLCTRGRANISAYGRPG